MKRTQRAQHSGRHAFTLVELMVALTIASVLTVIALPQVKEALRQNIATRSATIVKGALVNARAQAIRTGRPFGVVIERQGHDIGSGNPSVLNFTAANYASRIYYVQTPLAYRGDTDDAYAYLFTEDSTGDPKFFVPQAHAGLIYASAARPQGPASQIVSPGTQMAIDESSHAFKITELDAVSDLSTVARNTLPASIDNTPGTVIGYNHTSVQPTYRVGTNFHQHQGYRFEILSLPMRAPFAPVNVTGKTVIDLSISGTMAEPVAFNTQTIVGGGSVSTGYEFGDVIIMFAPDGRLDAVYLDQPDGSGGYTFTRVVPSTTVSLAVGYVDGIVDNVDDNARYPEHVPGTSYPTAADDPPLATPAPPAALALEQVPNFANPEGAWISIRPMSGAVQLETVAAQPSLSELTTYYGFGSNPGQSARGVVHARIRQSRRLSSAGATQ